MLDVSKFVSDSFTHVTYILRLFLHVLSGPVVGLASCGDGRWCVGWLVLCVGVVALLPVSPSGPSLSSVSPPLSILCVSVSSRSCSSSHPHPVLRVSSRSLNVVYNGYCILRLHYVFSM
jgi:hypothetical protein